MKTFDHFCLYTCVLQIIETQIAPNECTEQRDPLQIIGVQNSITHVNITTTRTCEMKEIDESAVLNQSSNIFTSMENEMKRRTVIEFIVQKLRSYPPQLRDVVQCNISNIFHDADQVLLIK